jgi:type I restriction enzyme R subunit
VPAEPRHSEFAFETVIEAHLLHHGYEYECVPAGAFDRERAIFPQTVLAFIRDTQPAEWAKLETLHGDKTAEQILTDLCKWMDANGSLATLRHGFKCYGRTLCVAYFKAAHDLNPELEARYAANRLGLTRQLHFSPRSEKLARCHPRPERHPCPHAARRRPQRGALRHLRAARSA